MEGIEWEQQILGINICLEFDQVEKFIWMTCTNISFWWLTNMVPWKTVERNFVIKKVLPVYNTLLFVSKETVKLI